MCNSGATQSVDIKQELLRRLNEAEKKAEQSYLTVLGPGDTITYRIQNWRRIPMAFKKVIAVDYDGTITKDGGNYPEVGEVKEDAIECLKKMQESCKIALWTCRDGKPLQDALDYLESLGFVPDFVNCQSFTTGSPKMVAHTYIDDAAFPYVAASNTFWTDYWTTLQLLES